MTSETTQVPWRALRSPVSAGAAADAERPAGKAGDAPVPEVAGVVVLAPLVAGISSVLASGAFATMSGFEGQNIQANSATTSRLPPAPKPRIIPRFESEDFFTLLFPLPRVFRGDYTTSSSNSSFANSSVCGIVSGFLQAGQAIFRPAYSSLADSFFPHAHVTGMGISNSAMRHRQDDWLVAAAARNV